MFAFTLTRFGANSLFMFYLSIKIISSINYYNILSKNYTVVAFKKYRNSPKSLQHNLIIAHNSKCYRQMRTLFTKNFHSVSTGYKQTRPGWPAGVVLVLTIPVSFLIGAFRSSSERKDRSRNLRSFLMNH